MTFDELQFQALLYCAFVLSMYFLDQVQFINRFICQLLQQTIFFANFNGQYKKVGNAKAFGRNVYPHNYVKGIQNYQNTFETQQQICAQRFLTKNSNYTLSY
eukprot:TRINITY_DN3180_c0_g2_i2.p5 TRINITY_DN3180_c0_g2~~TRINITY_DN3180_c0_g2_i2.p5  ORF type:complete len:102 (-),score=1.57 TRINITY_DN3180_c0_g2_i2:620-925(-)